MSRLWPRSVASRTTLVLVAGMLLVVASGIAVGTMTMGGGQASLADRVATLAAVAETAPVSARPAVYAGAGRAGLSIRDVARTEATPAVSPDWFTDRLGERLAQELVPLGARVVAIGHTVGAEAGGPAHVWAPWAPILVWVELSDGTRLQVVGHGRWSPLELMGRLSPILLVIGIGLTGLAAWVARRVTRPLGRFAEATVRLGADVAAAEPLDEEGPIEIREVARAFNTMQEQIRRLLEGRTHMLAAVSHDLRTPLTRLRLRTEFVEDDEERAKMLKDLDEMEAMIHAAIGYARSDGGGESPVTADIAALVEGGRQRRALQSTNSTEPALPSCRVWALEQKRRGHGIDIQIRDAPLCVKRQAFDWSLLPGQVRGRGRQKPKGTPSGVPALAVSRRSSSPRSTAFHGPCA